jgi:hypothetical protein
MAAPSILGGGGTRYVFANWSNTGSTSFQMSQGANANTFTANYSTQYQVNVSGAYGGNVNVNPPTGDGYYAMGTSVSVSASPWGGFCFGGWSGLISGTSPSTAFTVDHPYTVSANFGNGGGTIQTGFTVLLAQGTTLAAPVTASSGCGWSASSSVDWITFPSGASGSQSGNLVYLVAPNTTGQPRTGTITVGNTTMTVLQMQF